MPEILKKLTSVAGMSRILLYAMAAGAIISPITRVLAAIRPLKHTEPMPFTVLQLPDIALSALIVVFIVTE